MSCLTSIRAVCVGSLGMGLACGTTYAADMSVKAPSMAILDQLDVHGYLDATYLNDYVTGNGLLVHTGGVAEHYATGLIFDLYKNKMGFINDVSIEVGGYTDLWSKQADVHVQTLNEFDWWVTGTVKFAQNWAFSAQYIQFVFPAYDQSNTNPPSSEFNAQFTLAYDDSWTGWPITFNPYIKLWDHIAGPSNVVLGQTHDALEGFLGMTPTINLMKYFGIPITVTAPTWFTFGPSTFWNSGIAGSFPPGVDVCGPLSNAPCAQSNFGYFTTGLTGTTALDPWVPKRLGSWYVKYGFQYYDFINQSLQAAQQFTDASGIPNVNEPFPSTKRDVFVYFAGIGMTF